jgi:hypothetical protein
MKVSIFLYFIILHILGDYYLQNEKLATDKKEEYKIIVIHALIYFIQAVLASIFLWNINVIYYIGFFSFMHFLIDSLKYAITPILLNAFKEKNKIDLNTIEARLYVVDQLLHISSIYILTHYFVDNVDVFNRLNILNSFASGINKQNILSFIIMILLILKPVNITFRILFSHIKPENNIASNEVEYRVGKLIGNLERLLITALLLVNQYTAIGLILTAKSITRYDKISKNQTFAEYYLLGTLFSMLATVIIYLSLFKINM